MKFNLKIIRRVNILAAGGLSGLYFFGNAYCLEDVKHKLELKINGMSAPVTPKVKNLIRDVMEDMKLGNEEKSLIQVFTVKDFDLKHLGYLDRKFGVFLGVPQHFALDKTSNFDVIPMVGNTHLSFDSPEAWYFKHSLSLSNEAKKFAVASEIFEAKQISFYLLGFLPPFIVLQANFISFLSEKLFKVLRKTQGKYKLPLFHGLIFVMAVWFYILLNDLINVYKQAAAEYLAAGLGTAYIEGGIEYYEKILERNKAIKKLDNNAPYTQGGELVKYMGFRTHSMPFERRIRLLKDFRKNYKYSDGRQNPLKYVL